MLTKEQEKQLKLLTKHKKYGKLLKSAILGWKKAEPMCRSFGLVLKEGKLTTDYRNSCCLLGAALLNKKPKTDWENSSYGLESEKRFNLTVKEIAGLIWGFDDRDFSKKDRSQYAFSFAQKIRNIVNPKQPF